MVVLTGDLRRVHIVSRATIMAFELISDKKPKGDQPEAIKQLVNGVENGDAHQILLGVTGSGKHSQWPTSLLRHRGQL